MEEKTLKKAKNELREVVHEGAICPCCNQFVKSYKRKITSSMAYALIILSKEVSSEFHLQDTAISLKINARIVADFAKLRFWGLVIQHQGKREDGSSRNGFYTITELGRQYINGRICLIKYKHVYNNIPYKESGGLLYIKDSLGEKFNYNEIMGYEK